MKPCRACATETVSCGTWGTVDAKRPCVRCTVPTGARSKCGAPRHYACVVQTTITYASVQSAGERPRGPWLGERTAEARTRAVRATGSLQPRLVADLQAAGISDPGMLAEAVALWTAMARGIEYRGEHGTALMILDGSLRHRSIPALEAMPLDVLAPVMDAERFTRRSWMVHGEMRGAGRGNGDTLAAYDINGMYLSAAGELELGTGSPDHVTSPADAVLRHPGYVRVAAIDGAPWSIGEHLAEDMWMPTPMAAYLASVPGCTMLLSEALVWPTHRRWLNPHVTLLRAMRSALIGDDSPAAVALLDIVKSIYTRIFGGLLASEDHNHGATLRPDWRDMVVSTAQARMFRALDRTRAPGVGVAGIHVDAAWFVMPAGYTDPPGLILSEQLGKFKAAGRVPWTADVAALHHADAHRTMRKMFKDGE